MDSYTVDGNHCISSETATLMQEYTRSNCKICDYDSLLKFGMIRIADWPLVNVYISMENHHAITVKIHYKSPLSIANC